MDDARFLAAIERDAAALLEAASSADADAMVPGCPEWRPIDLVWHLGEVHGFWATVVARRLQEPPEAWPPERPASDEDVVEFTRRSAAELLDALRAAEPSDAVWTWSPRQDVGWVIRRMAQETAVHRVDAEQVAGRPTSIDAELAADGVDEFLEYFLPYLAKDAPPYGGSVHLHCTDAEGEWTITPASDDQLVVTREHTKADTALRGPASDLLLAMWRRLDLADTAIQVFGDEELARGFLARTDNR